MKVKSELWWGPLDVRDVRAMRHMPTRDGKGSGISPREIYFADSKIGGVAASKTFETAARVMRCRARDLVLVLLAFSLALVQFSLTLLYASLLEWKCTFCIIVCWKNEIQILSLFGSQLRDCLVSDKKPLNFYTLLRLLKIVGNFKLQ